MESGVSGLLLGTLIGNRPLMARFRGWRGVSVPSLDSSPVISASDRLLMVTIAASCFCLRNFLMCAVTVTSVTSLSFRNPSFGGLGAWTCRTSGGGKMMGFPSSFNTCNDTISARHSGSSDIIFFCTDSTFNEDSLTMSGGRTLSLFRPRSRISRDLRSHS